MIRRAILVLLATASAALADVPRHPSVGRWTNDSLAIGYSEQLRQTLGLVQPNGTFWNQTYGYDGALRLQSLTAPPGVFAYGYGTAGTPSALVRSVTLPDWAWVTNHYDGLDRLDYTGLQNVFGHELDGYGYGYDALGLRTNITRYLGITSNSVAVGYDAVGQLVSWSAKEAGGALRQNEQLGFGFDAAHNLSARTNGGLSQTWVSDVDNQLTSVTRAGTLTVSGATPVPATNVTVNGAGAQTYGDFTFAATNNTLTNGSNTFTVVARNIYGQGATNVVALNLPASVSLQYDANGNLTNDGTRAFAYDAENRVVSVWVTNGWRSDLVYDGLSRRRAERDYGWQGGGWVETNETHVIYDGLAPLQERNSNSAPQTVTYTRGLDLSGSLQGAGGIGGLLARTDGNGSTYYHADGAGNVTLMLDGNQNLAARYLYGAFGRVTAQWGALSGTNVMQFSSMPRQANSGLSLFMFRGYDPALQRWITRDPIGEMGGINLYGFVGNNALGWVDPLGLDGLWMSPDGHVHTTTPPSEQPTGPNFSNAGLLAGEGFGINNDFSGLTGGEVGMKVGQAVPEGFLQAAMMLGVLVRRRPGPKPVGGFGKHSRGLPRRRIVRSSRSSSRPRTPQRFTGACTNTTA
jgi:RHS repeat-associated protein